MKPLLLPRRLTPGAAVVVRTRWGSLRRLTVRVVADRWLIGHNQHGICHRARMNQIVHVEYR